MLIDYFNELILDQEWEFTTTKPSLAELEGQSKETGIRRLSVQSIQTLEPPSGSHG